MGRVYSRNGCLTCLQRRKKCDEATPVCRACYRLRLTCVPRKQKDGQDRTEPRPTTAVAAAALPAPLQPPISNGYVPFSSAYEKQISQDSPHILNPFLSKFASVRFHNMPLFGSLCAQNKPAREAMVAFAAYGRVNSDLESYKICVKSYQKCIVGIPDLLKANQRGLHERNIALAVTLFLGLLEGLTLGDPRNALAHFEMCRRLLVKQLSNPKALKDGMVRDFYRIAAECVTYNFATLSPNCPDADEVLTDWGTSFDCLFPGNQILLSPFMSGMGKVYWVMFRANTLLRRVTPEMRSSSRSDVFEDDIRELRRELDGFERELAGFQPEDKEGQDAIDLHRTKCEVHLTALRIHLVKINRPSASASDQDVQVQLRRALKTLAQSSLYEPDNPQVRWPLSILACAAHTKAQFDAIMTAIEGIGGAAGRSNSYMMRAMCNTLRLAHKATTITTTTTSASTEDVDTSEQYLESQLDYLLKPESLFEPPAL